DVAGALAKYLAAGGHDVKLFTPLYTLIDRAKFPMRPVDGLQQVPLQVGPHHYVFSVFTTPLPGSDALVHLIDCPVLYARPVIYTTDPDEHLRFLAFTRSVLTIHNIGYQGVFSSAAIADLELCPKSYLLHQDDLRVGKINPLRHGILYADAITTVSPTHAREICTDQYGMGLQDSLLMREEALTGILNGVDYEIWDPRNDRYLPEHYDPGRLSIKEALKRAFI